MYRIESSKTTVMRPFGRTLFAKSTVSIYLGWSDLTVAIDNFQCMPMRPTYLDNNRALTYSAYSRCEWGCFGYFLFPAISQEDGCI